MIGTPPALTVVLVTRMLREAFEGQACGEMTCQLDGNKG